MSIEYTPGPLLDAARNTPTALWNDSSDPSELAQSISFGGVGATCNPTIAYTCINQRRDVWLPRIAELAKEMPDATESEIGWQVVRELSLEAAKLLEPIFEAENGRNGRLSMQTDPRLARSAKALADQAEEFHNLAKNIIVKIPATSVGIEAIEEATYRGVSVNVTVSFSVAQAVTTGEAIERGLKRREAEGKDTSQMGPVVTLMVGRIDSVSAITDTFIRERAIPTKMGVGRSGFEIGDEVGPVDNEDYVAAWCASTTVPSAPWSRLASASALAPNTLSRCTAHRAACGGISSDSTSWRSASETVDPPTATRAPWQTRRGVSGLTSSPRSAPRWALTT